MMSYFRQVLPWPLTPMILLTIGSSHFTSADVLACSSSTITISFDYEPKIFRYPESGQYPTSVTCRWLFEAKASDFTFFLRFTDINIGSETFNIYDGQSSISTKLYDSGGITSSTDKNYRHSTTDKVFVEFTSDTTPGSDETGFTLEIGNGKDTSGCSTPSTSQTITLSSSPYFLTSPDFPKEGGYPLNTNCTWTFTTSDQSATIVVRFLYYKFDKYQGRCYDNVKVYEGSTVMQSALIESQLCDDRYLSTETRNSTGNSITVDFYSDGVSTGRGFLALVYEIGAQSSTAEQTTTPESTTTTPADTMPLTTTEATTTMIQTTITMVTSTESPTTLASTDSVTINVTTPETQTTSDTSSKTSTVVTSKEIPTTTIISTATVTSTDSSTSTITSTETPTPTTHTSTDAASTEVTATTNDTLMTTPSTETPTTASKTTTQETITETLSSTELHVPTSSTSDAVLTTTQETVPETLSSKGLPTSSTSETVLITTPEAMTETLSSTELTASSTFEAILTTTRQITNESKLTAESVVVIVASCISLTFLVISMIGVYICFTILNRRKRPKHGNEHRKHSESEHLYIRYFANYSPASR